MAKVNNNDWFGNIIMNWVFLFVAIILAGFITPFWGALFGMPGFPYDTLAGLALLPKDVKAHMK